MDRQLHSCWRLGKRKPGIVSDGEGLVEAAGESIEVRGVGFSWGVGVSASEGDGVWVVNFCMKPLGRRQLDSVREAAAMSGKEAAMR